MANIMDEFPSNYLKAADLQKRDITVAIDRVTREEVGQNKDLRLVLYFIGKEKGMIVNKTNAQILSMLIGADYEGWHGARICLYEAMVNFQGGLVPAIRIKAARGNGGTQQSRQAQAQPDRPNKPQFIDRDGNPVEGEAVRSPAQARQKETGVPWDDDINF